MRNSLHSFKVLVLCARSVRRQMIVFGVMTLVSLDWQAALTQRGRGAAALAAVWLVWASTG